MFLHYFLTHSLTVVSNFSLSFRYCLLFPQFNTLKGPQFLGFPALLSVLPIMIPSSYLDPISLFQVARHWTLLGLKKIQNVLNIHKVIQTKILSYFKQ